MASPAHPNLCHLDDGVWSRTDKPPLQGERKRLGPLVGTVDVGVSQYRLGPGERVMPVHVHADEEELFYVTSGSGFSYEDGQAHPIAAGDLCVYLENGPAHTIVAGEEGIEYLAFGEGSRTSITFLPRAGAWWQGPRWLPADGPNPFKAEVLAGPLELPEPSTERPSTIVHRDAVPGDRYENAGFTGTDRNLAKAAGSVRTGLRLYAVDPGQASAPFHWHTGEEELFLVLEGAGELRLGEERFDVGPGHLLGRPPNSGVAHAFVAGEAPLLLLGYGTRVTTDICFYPDSQKVSLGRGHTARLPQLDYWDGE